ncbi:phosphonate ABC transporter, permease protein PhnE, partial [Mesorhizobium sp. M7A.F.Ca.US.001.04.2.1]
MSVVLSESGLAVENHWKELANRRRLYTLGGVVFMIVAMSGSLWFANETNAGKFFDRLPHFFDFIDQMLPRDGWEIWRALFDLPSPYDDGSLKYNYPEGRVYLTQALYIPEYVYKMIETVNIALVSTLIGFVFGFVLCFLAASNLTTKRWLRFFVRRFFEILRAFPEIVIAGFFLAVLSLGPIPAIMAVGIHTIGALGKMFFEVVENADMKPDDGLKAVGANWIERVWFGIVPQVMPNFLSYALLRLEINVRASTIIGAVGGGGIGEPLRLSINQTHEAKTLAMILLLLLTIIA